VVRLKGGDPFIFGRGAEELEFLLQRGIGCQVVPGITAAAGCAAAANLPLTHRGLSSSVTFLAGHEAGENEESGVDWKRLPKDGTLAIYMGVARIEAILRGLLDAGFPGDARFAVVENGTRPGQRVLRGFLSDLPRVALESKVRSPAMLFIGRTAAPLPGIPAEGTCETEVTA